MRRTLKIFVIPAGKPAGPPEPGPEVELEAPSEDALLATAHEAFAKRGQRARAVSLTSPSAPSTSLYSVQQAGLRTVRFTPTGLVAYAEAAP